MPILFNRVFNSLLEPLSNTDGRTDGLTKMVVNLGGNPPLSLMREKRQDSSLIESHWDSNAGPVSA